MRELCDQCKSDPVSTNCPFNELCESCLESKEVLRSELEYERQFTNHHSGHNYAAEIKKYEQEGDLYDKHGRVR